MRCRNCVALRKDCSAESYESDWWCAAGVSDDDLDEDSHGELGCGLHYQTIKKKVKEFDEENEKAWLEDAKNFVNWIEKNKEELEGIRT